MLQADHAMTHPPALPPFDTMPWRGRTFLWMSLAIISGVLMGATLLALLLLPATSTGDEVTLTTAYMVAVLALQGVVMLLCIYLFGMLRQRLGWQQIGFTPISWQWIGRALGLTILLRVGVTLLALALAPLGIVSEQANSLAPEGFSWLGAIGMLLFGGIVVPLAEEIFFRGMLYRWLRSRWSIRVATLVSSLIFALIHVELATIIPAFLIGLVCAVSFERSRSLWTPFLIHCANNLIGIGLLYALLAAGVSIPGLHQ